MHVIYTRWQDTKIAQLAKQQTVQSFPNKAIFLATVKGQTIYVAYFTEIRRP